MRLQILAVTGDCCLRGSGSGMFGNYTRHCIGTMRSIVIVSKQHHSVMPDCIGQCIYQTAG